MRQRISDFRLRNKHVIAAAVIGYALDQMGVPVGDAIALAVGIISVPLLWVLMAALPFVVIVMIWGIAQDGV